MTAALRVILSLNLFGACPLARQEKPVVLYPGVGLWTPMIATSNPQAQKYFDQGLSLV
jgi:hypothetical protein